MVEDVAGLRAAGTATLSLSLPPDAMLVGGPLRWRAFALGAMPVASVRMSNGLATTFCDWP